MNEAAKQFIWPCLSQRKTFFDLSLKMRMPLQFDRKKPKNVEKRQTPASLIHLASQKNCPCKVMEGLKIGS